MAITQYTQPADMQLMDTYTPIPFRELLAAGQAKQQRVEQGIAAKEALQTDLGTFDALDEVQVAGGRRVKVGDRERVQARIDEYNQTLNQLSAQYQDPSSIEFRTGVKKIISDLRRDKSPTGILGMAAANVARHKDIQKQLIEAKQLGDRPHLAADLYSQLEDFAVRSQDGIVGLGAAAPIGEGIDQQAAVADLMKNLTASYLGDEFAASGRVPGFVEKRQIERISYEDAYNTAKSLIATNPDLIRDLGLRQSYAAQTGRQFNAEQAADNLAKTMANLFKQNKVKFDTQSDPFALATFKKGLEDQDREAVLSTNVAIGIPASIYNTPDKLQTLTEELKLDGKQITAAKDEFISQNDIDVTTGLGADGVDYSMDLAEYRRQEEFNKAKYTQLERLDMKVRDKIGLPMDYQPPQDVVERAKHEAGKLYESQAKIAHTLSVTPEEYVGKTKEQFVEDNYNEYLKDVDPKYKEYRETFKELSKATAEIVGVTEVPKKLAETTTIKEGLRLFTPDFDTAVKNVSLATTGETLNRNEFEKHDFTKGQLQGYFFDPADNGKMKLLYSVPTKEKEGKQAGASPKGFITVKTAAPSGFDMALMKKGYIQPLDQLINNQLYNELGPVSGFSGDGQVLLGTPEDGTRMKFDVEKDLFTGKWTIVTETADGPKVIPAVSAGDAISKIRTVYKLNLEANK